MLCIIGVYPARAGIRNFRMPASMRATEISGAILLITRLGFGVISTDVSASEGDSRDTATANDEYGRMA